MIKKLSAKVQQLNSQDTGENKAFSGCIVIEPEDRALVLKKGSIYGVFSISSSKEFDQGLVRNIIMDLLKESYFQTDSISPIQSIEKAIVDVREKVTSLIVKDTETTLNFNMLCSVLWGNVLYVVKFGEGESFLVRQGEIRQIKTMSEGSFSAASGVIKDEDVVITGTQAFSQQYPPDKLLSMAISEQALAPEESGMLLKFMVDTDFTQDEVVDFGLEDAPKKKSKELKFDFLQKIKPVLGSVASKIKGIKIKNPEQEQTTSIRLKAAKRPLFTPKLLIPAAFLALAVSIFFTLRNPDKGTGQQVNDNEQGTDTGTVEVTPPEQSEPQEPEEPEEEVFYDLKLTDLQAAPNEIAIFPSYVVVSDNTSGKVYISSREEPKFEGQDTNFKGANSIKNTGNGELFEADNEGFKFYDIVDKKVTESYTQSTGSASDTYLGYLYTAREGSIYKYTVSGNELQEEIWSTDSDFDNARSMSIAFSIYVLTGDDRIVSYTSGTKDNFELSDLETPLKDAVKIETGLDLENIYIADRGNNRVVAVDKDGNFVKEYRSQTAREWTDLKDIGISPDESVMYVLNGTRVYEVQLGE